MACRTWEALTTEFANDMAYAGGLGKLMKPGLFEVREGSTPPPPAAASMICRILQQDSCFTLTVFKINLNGHRSGSA